jgi:hypothetical protein
MTFLLIYLLLDISFAISSYFFIHKKAYKMYKRKDSLTDSLAYILAALLLFPFIVFAWYNGYETLLQVYGDPKDG